MISEQQYISKGIYQYSQIGNFISVKNYIFLRRNEKKYLMIRFSNDLDYTVDSISYTLVQLDASGKVIERKNVYHGEMDFRPGAEYINTELIEVDEYCAEFKVLFSEVLSGRYRYRVREKMVAVYYDKDPEPIVEIPAKRREKKKLMDEEIEDYYVDRKKFLETGVASFVATMIVFLLLGLNALNLYRSYTQAREDASGKQNESQQTEEVVRDSAYRAGTDENICAAIVDSIEI